MVVDRAQQQQRRFIVALSIKKGSRVALDIPGFVHGSVGKEFLGVLPILVRNPPRQLVEEFLCEFPAERVGCCRRFDGQLLEEFLFHRLADGVEPQR